MTVPSVLRFRAIYGYFGHGLNAKRGLVLGAGCPRASGVCCGVPDWERRDGPEEGLASLGVATTSRFWVPGICLVGERLGGSTAIVAGGGREREAGVLVVEDILGRAAGGVWWTDGTR